MGSPRASQANQLLWREHMISATAMALYIYNVSPGVRAEMLYRHFKGNCAEPDELLRWVDHHSWATQMPWPTAKVYLIHAMERYGDEATNRVRMNESFDPKAPGS